MNKYCERFDPVNQYNRMAIIILIIPATKVDFVSSTKTEKKIANYNCSCQIKSGYQMQLLQRSLISSDKSHQQLHDYTIMKQVNRIGNFTYKYNWAFYYCN